MFKFTKVCAATLVIASALSSTAFAGQWKQDATGYWWERGDGSYFTDTWK